MTCASPLNLGAAGAAYGAVVVGASSLELHGPQLAALLPDEQLAAAAAAPGASLRDGGRVLRLPVPVDEGPAALRGGGSMGKGIDGGRGST